MLAAQYLAIVVAAVAAIASDWRQRRPAFYLLKPLTTLLILALAAQRADFSDAHDAPLVFALGLCLIGDICLLSHRPRAFGWGIAAFYFAHYLFVLSLLAGVLGPPYPRVLPAAVLAAALIGLSPGLRGNLRWPVRVYGLMLLTMAGCAAFRYQQLGGSAALMLLAGALLFVASDALLAWRKFRRDFAGAQALVLGSYWLALLLMAGSLLR